MEGRIMTTTDWREVVPADKDERHRWMGIILRASIAYQVRSMRLMRGWTQETLADKAGLSTPTISRVEDPAAEIGLEMKTLQLIAQAFDVALFVRFASWEDFVREMVGLIPPAAFGADGLDSSEAA